ncbi:serine hydrolase domain-containing protein [Kitasatospora camelliae]|uniref:Serine hydrolase domain-containing protein n=1 Tax=Kitasatospora camelliae TaxID=3156397 RepID=A0AAU8JUA6_9ACTN
MHRDDTWPERAAAELRPALAAAVSHGNVPGAVAVLGRPGTALVVLTHGTLGAECGPHAPDRHTRYDLASLTKVLATWPLVGQARHAARLDLDAPIRTIDAELPPPGADLTVRQLMAHTSGLLPETNLAQYHHSGRPLAHHLCAEPLVSTPGTEHRYVDRGFILLGLLLPTVLGAPLDRLADDLWRDLGLTATAYGPLPRSPQLAPTEQRLLGAPRTWGIPHDPSAALLGGVAGHAGVFSTAADLAAFAERLLDPPDPLAAWLAAWLAESARPQAAAGPGLHRGLAWLGTGDGRALYHHGYTGTSLYLSPATGRYLVLLTNAVYHGWDRARLTPVRDLALRLVARSP